MRVPAGATVAAVGSWFAFDDVGHVLTREHRD